MKRHSARAGFSLLEVSVSILIVGAMASLIAQALLWRGVQQRSIQRRELALIEAGNLMDRAASLADGELTQEKLDSFTLSESMQNRTPPATLHWHLEPAEGQPAARRITLEIELPGKAGADARPVRLTAWRFGVGGNGNSERGGRLTD